VPIGAPPLRIGAGPTLTSIQDSGFFPSLCADLLLLLKEGESAVAIVLYEADEGCIRAFVLYKARIDSSLINLSDDL